MSEPDPVPSAEASATPQGLPTHVVGIGASAGGLNPLEEFFTHLPDSSGAAYVVVQHLSPDFKSLMKELLSRHTARTVVRIEDGMRMEADSIYLIPPKSILTIQDGCLQVGDQEESDDGHRPLSFPIDRFFESLAGAYGPDAIGVILSGTGSDGTKGARAIADAGGTVFVQDPSSAQFDGMPRSAMRTLTPDFVLPPDQIARTVYECVSNSETRTSLETESESASDSRLLDRVVNTLREDRNTDFSDYKRSTILRRIRRRMSVSNCVTADQYLSLLEGSETERAALCDDLLIGVTRFFRDPETWEYMATEIIPKVVAGAKERDGIRAWVAGCASGEEAYTLRMLLLEEMERQEVDVEVKIFATDLDRRSLEIASAGTYREAISQDLTPKRLDRFFVRQDKGVRVSRRLREGIIFAEHNLVRDAPFKQVDIVCCRNVLIYMQPALQRQVLGLLHNALTVEGTLLLGSAETLGNLESEFHVVERRFKIYQKKRDVTLASGTRDGLADLRTAGRWSVPTQPRPRLSHALATEISLRSFLKARHGALFLVNGTSELAHAIGEVGAFLRVPEGTTTRSILKMVPESLSLPLSTALHRAMRDKEVVTYTDLSLDHEGGRILFDLSCVPISNPEENFEGVGVLCLRRTGVTRTTESGNYDPDSAATAQIEELDRELQHTRESLQAMIEELETSNEEQQATNEELLASNEELQSTNEELQSVNEELYAVNAEYQSKIQELVDINNDMDTFLDSTRIGALFLDHQLRIRKFTPEVQRFVNVIDPDVGRPLEHLSTQIGIADLSTQIMDVVRSSEGRDVTTTTSEGHPLLVRIHPYASEELKQRGAVVTFIDLHNFGMSTDSSD